MNTNNKTVSTIIPAHNEGKTICGVIKPMLGHSLIDEIIVVDDGSTDDTAKQARSMGVKLISLPTVRGKAAAMSRGVRAARNDVVFFCDADVVGLTPEMVARIVTPVTSGEYGMYVGIRGRKTYWANRLLRVTPILGGERALTRTLWNRVPRTYKKNFQIEIALNFFAKRLGQRMGFTVVHGLSQVIKEKKRGFWLGLWQRLRMMYDIVLISWRIYVVLHLRLLIGWMSPQRDAMASTRTAEAIADQEKVARAEDQGAVGA
jgi:glycosyltransferase involved in cell wall biosynthesis